MKSFLWGIFEKPEILARDVFKTPQRRNGKDIFFEICPMTSYRRHTKDIFFVMYLRRLKDVTKKTSFLRCI